MSRFKLCRSLFLIIGLCVTAPALADCTPSTSGLSAYTCSGSGTTGAQVNSAISRAADNAVITFSAGTYTTSGIVMNSGNRNGITIICATAPQTVGAAASGGCQFTSTSTAFIWNSGSSSNMMRISGFEFTATGSQHPFDLGYASDDPTILQFRIDHNTCRRTTTGCVKIGHGAGFQNILGVFDHNLFTGSTNDRPFEMFGRGHNDWTTSWNGTTSNIFIEDNEFNYTTDSAGSSGMDMVWGGRMVVRFNRIRNARASVHGVCHIGPANFEFYGNAMEGVADSGRMIHHQGSGEILIFNNSLEDAADEIVIQHYRSDSGAWSSCGQQPTYCDGTQSVDGNRSPLATFRGYPCWRQPGRDGLARLWPMYTFLNTVLTTNTLAPISIQWTGGQNYLAEHFAVNRDRYQGINLTANFCTGHNPNTGCSPFDGTVGVGHGPLAERPSTCTANAQPQDAGRGGVGYWATDQGNWNSSTSNPRGVQMNGADGVLYTCTATNTWSVWYTPAPYPHALQGGAPSDTTPPAAPTGVTITQLER